MITKKITWKQALDYEVRGSWWTPYVGDGWMQNIVSRYFARKVVRRLDRYLKSKNHEELMMTLPDILAN